MASVEEHNAAHNLHFLLTHAKKTVESCIAKWNGSFNENEMYQAHPNPCTTVGDEPNQLLTGSTSVNTKISWIQDILDNLQETNQQEFWSKDQRLICLTLCKPTIFEMLKLRRKMERLTQMIERTMNQLYPVLKDLPDYNDFDLGTTDADVSIADTLNELQVLASSRGNIISRTLVRLCTCGRLSRKQERLPRISEIPVSALNKKIMESRTPSVPSAHCEQLISTSSKSEDLEELESTELTATCQNTNCENVKVTVPLANNGLDELKNLVVVDNHEEPASKTFDTVQSDNANENILLSSKNSATINKVQPFPLDPFQCFKNIVNEVQALTKNTISDIRNMERNFYDPPKECKCLKAEEFSDFVKVVLKIGKRLTETVKKYQNYQDKDGLIKDLKKIEKVGIKCQHECQKFTEILQTDTKMFNGCLYIYQVPYEEYTQSSKSTLKVAALDVENCLSDFHYHYSAIEK